MKPRRKPKEAALELISYERRQHDVIVPIETIQAGVKAMQVVTATPADRYLRRRQIGEALHAACQRYYALVRLAGFEPLPQTAGLVRVDNGQGSPERAQVAKREVFAADAAMGPTQAHCVRSVGVEGWSAEAWAVRTGRHPKCGIEFFRDGLELLARHWGMA